MRHQWPQGSSPVIATLSASESPLQKAHGIFQVGLGHEGWEVSRRVVNGVLQGQDVGAGPVLELGHHLQVRHPLELLVVYGEYLFIAQAAVAICKSWPKARIEIFG